jgi:hypothetical protein
MSIHFTLSYSVLYYQFQYCLPHLRHDSVKTAFLISAMRAKRPVHRIQVWSPATFITSYLCPSFATQSWQTIPYRRSRLAVNVLQPPKPAVFSPSTTCGTAALCVVTTNTQNIARQCTISSNSICIMWFLSRSDGGVYTDRPNSQRNVSRAAVGSFSF